MLDRNDVLTRDQPLANDAATLLGDVHEFIRRFVAYPSPETAVAHVLWIVHAHLMKCWETTPRLAFLSTEPASGKTRALEITALLAPRPIQAVNMSSAALFRVVGRDSGLPTVLFDEIDAVFGPKAKENEELRGLINAGYRRGNKTYRCFTREGKVDVEEIEAFSAVALAGLGHLPDTILSRSIVVRMKRRARNESIEPYRHRDFGLEGELLCRRLSAWTGAIEGCASDFRPELPHGIEDRNADIWEPLIVVADLAGGRWPSLARAAAVKLVSTTAADSPSLGVKLLADIRAIFGIQLELETSRLIEELCELDESPWADLRGHRLNATGLARMLKDFGARPHTIRFGRRTAKGYHRSDFADAWHRYLPPPSSNPKHP